MRLQGRARAFVNVRHGRIRVLPRCALPQDSIVPDFLYAYTTFICKNPECIKTMVIPPVYEQLYIMQQMFDVSSKVDISGLEEPFMKLLLMHDSQGVDVLTRALIQYQKSKDVIKSVIEYTKEIPGLVISAGEEL
jgi:hypothetical protein